MTLQRVLVVDDEPVVREVLCKLLALPHREVVGTEGFDDALAAARAQAFDVALIDKNLVGQSGLELTRALRKEQPQVEVILMSGYASVESAIEAVQIGCFEYVTKPIEDFAALDLKIQNAIDKSRLLRQQRDLQARLFESELRYRTLFEATPDALLVCDARTGALADANPAAIALYGYPAADLLALRASDLVAEGGEGRRHLRRDGGTFAAEVTRSRFELSGVPLETLSVRDVSAREAAEREQHALEARLRQAQKMDAIGRLAGGVAHDFNSLLAVIHAHADFLADVIGRDQPARADVEGIRQAAQRGAALTRQLLLFGRSKKLESAPVDLNALVVEVRKLLARVMGAEVQLVPQLIAAPWLARADPDQLSQVLINLAINARDAMPEGGEVRIETGNELLPSALPCHGGELPAGRYARLTVRDAGTGMTREVVARLFEPFFTTKAPGQGTGLGLATVYGIVRNAGGGIFVESALGKGSAFTLLLPAEPDRPAFAPLQELGAPAGSDL